MQPLLDYLPQIVPMLVTAGAIYGGIRADMRNMKDGIKAAQESAGKAHTRLDNHLDHSRP
jgi:outer membrane murein-binding lipoprotein Lpp